VAFDGKTIDLAKPVSTSDPHFDVIPSKDGASIVVRIRDHVGHVAEAGALFAYSYVRIALDATSHQPVVADHWECDETKAPGGSCEAPAWSNELDDATASPGVSADLKLPGACGKLTPSAQYTAIDIGDLDGDGTADAVVHALPGDKGATACGRDNFSCPQTVFVRRGACGHNVGVLAADYATVSVEKTRTNGLADLVVEGPAGKATYTFNGTAYVVKR
jgi:hypothetical protein